MAQKKFSSSPLSSETKPNRKLVLVLNSWEPLLNKLNKQNVYEIDSVSKFNFSQSQEILDTLINVRNSKHSKHHFCLRRRSSRFARSSESEWDVAVFAGMLEFVLFLRKGVSDFRIFVFLLSKSARFLGRSHCHIKFTGHNFQVSWY